MPSFNLDLLAARQQYILILVLLGAVLARLVIHFVAGRTRARGTAAARLMKPIESASTPLLIIGALGVISYRLPLAAEFLSLFRRGLGVAAVGIAALAVSKIVSSGFESFAGQQRNLERYIQPLRLLTTAAIILGTSAAALRILNVSLGADGLRFLRVGWILLVSYVALKLVHLVVGKMESLVDDNNPNIESEAEKRARTLGRILNSTAMVIIVGVALMMILSEFGMNIMPIITGAGIAGLAFGFGAQNLVRDIISGFFFILENQIRVGDVAIINGTGGLVEAINLRTIVLRDLQGVVHIFPNGAITQVSNMTKEWSRYVIDVGVAYKEDVDRVMRVLEEIGDEFCRDEQYKPLILDKLEILGVDDFGESQITIKVMIKTLPLKQWLVGRELRRRIKNTFDRKGIEIPFPQMTLHLDDNGRRFEAMLKDRSKVEKAG